MSSSSLGEFSSSVDTSVDSSVGTFVDSSVGTFVDSSVGTFVDSSVPSVDTFVDSSFSLGTDFSGDSSLSLRTDISEDIEEFGEEERKFISDVIGISPETDEDTEGENEEEMKFSQELLNISETPSSTRVPAIINIPKTVRPSFRSRRKIPQTERRRAPRIIAPRLPQQPQVEITITDKINELNDLDYILEGMKYKDRWNFLRKQIVTEIWNKGTKASLSELISISSLLINRSMYGCKYSFKVEEFLNTVTKS